MKNNNNYFMIKWNKQIKKNVESFCCKFSFINKIFICNTLSNLLLQYNNLIEWKNKKGKQKDKLCFFFIISETNK